MSDCKQELHGLLLVQEWLVGAGLFVLKKKSDISGGTDEAELRQALGLDTITKHRWHVIEYSAITGQNVLDGLHYWVAQDAKERLFLLVEGLYLSMPMMHRLILSDEA